MWTDFYLSEQRTLNFYLWEHRGRGWDIYDSEVALEPAFEPFSFDPNLLDLSSLANPKEIFLHYLRKGFTEGLKSSVHDVRPFHFGVGQEGVNELKKLTPIVASIKVASDEKVTLAQLKQFFVNLCYSSHHIGFEIIGSADSIRFQLTCFESDFLNALQQAQSHFPFLTIAKDADILPLVWYEALAKEVLEFGLDEEFMRPLQINTSLDPDPLTGVIASLEELKGDEVGVFQILFQATRYPWSESIVRSVSDENGKSFLSDAPEMVNLAQEKVIHPLFACVLRIAAQAPSKERAKDIARNLSSGLKTVSRSGSNSLIPLSNREYDALDHENDLLYRRSHRTGMILNVMELGMLVHPPSPSVSSFRFQRAYRKSKIAPREVMGHSLILGENVYRNTRTPVTLNLEQRLRHIYIIGATGTGKSTLILNLLRQNAGLGEACAVIDPHGDLIDRILEQIPEERLDDVIVFDPSDTEYPVGFNILRTRSEVEKNVISSDLVAIFRRFSTSWGDQMTTVMGNAVSAMLECSRPMTLTDLRHFLADGAFRKGILESVTDSHVRYFWEKEFPSLKGNSENSILTRLDSFLRPKLIRNIIEQPEGLDFANLINTKKILLIKLAQGVIGEENSYLLGSLLVSKLHQTIMARQVENEMERVPFTLYLDEFQNFITPSMTAILSGARKFRMSLVMSHQDLRQLWDYDTKLANSVISNAATRICFRLGDFDAEKLHAGFSSFDSSDLQNLGVGEAICRVERKDYDFNLRTYETPVIAIDKASRKRERIVTLSRSKYGHRIVKELEEIRGPLLIKEEPVFVPIPASRPKEILKKEYSPSKEAVVVKQQLDISSKTNKSQRQEISQHRYLQTLIKKMAEQRGYRAVIEEPTPDGSGRVDVGLERDGKKIGVEISVTTGDIQELHNIEKCLNAGYEIVIACSPEKKNLEAIRKLITERLQEPNLGKVKFFEPQEFFLFLDQQIAESQSSEQRIKGYRVKVKYESVSEAEKKQKREAVAQVIVSAMRRMKSQTDLW